MTRRQWYSFLSTTAAVVVLVFKLIFPDAEQKNSQEVTTPSIAQSTTSTQMAPVEPVHSSSTHPTNALVVRVADGDTLEAQMDGASSTIKVRFLGVNTPETVDPRRAVECFGKEASAFTKQLLQGKRVLLKEDPQADNIDKYGRSLRNIFLEDGTDVNALLVKEGYAYAYVSFPQNKQRKAELKRLQEEAKLAKRGLWNLSTCDGMK